jgi:hypothetical protein
MKYAKLIEILYNEYENKNWSVKDIISEAVTISEAFEQEKGSQILHTGIIFVEEQVNWELFYDMKTETIFKHEREEDSRLPYLNGLFLIWIAGQITFDNRVLNEIPFDSNENGIYYEGKIELYEDAEGELIKFDKEPDSSEEATLWLFNEKTNIVDTQLLDFKVIYPDKEPLQYHFFHFIYDEDIFETTEEGFEDDNILFNEQGYQNERRYAGTWAQEVEGLSDDYIDDVLDGDPDAYWNID